MQIDKILQKCAEILVECGYANQLRKVSKDKIGKYVWVKPKRGRQYKQLVTVFTDTLEGRRQACSAIEHIRVKYNHLWIRSKTQSAKEGQTWWEHALGRLEWCIQELIK